MDIANIVAMFGAIATFLFGMSTMTDGLEKLSSGRLEHILERLTSNVFKGVLLGAVVTGLIQSSAATLKNRHVERLKAGECTIELGTQFLELLINLERMSDHCSNVALHILRQTSSPDDKVRIDSHAYMHELHHGGFNQEFDDLFQEYRTKYFQPIARDPERG